MSSPRQFCTFQLAHFLFGLEVHSIQEIIRFQEMTPVPLAPATVHGLINLRGQIVTAVDLRTRLNLPARPDHARPTNVIIPTPGGAVSLLVDEIGDIIELAADTFEPPPETLQGPARAVVSGVHKLKSQLLLLLNLERTLQLTDSA